MCGPQRCQKLASIRLNRPVIGEEHGKKSGQNVYKLLIQSHQWSIDFGMLFRRNAQTDPSVPIAIEQK
jgi:hypothetical protein